jgi:hypothetical protein
MISNLFMAIGLIIVFYIGYKIFLNGLRIFNNGNHILGVTIVLMSLQFFAYPIIALVLMII